MNRKRLDETLVSKAVTALLEFETKKRKEAETSSLVGTHSKGIMAQIQLESEIKKPVIRPVRVKIPNSMFSYEKEEHRVCLFCRSEDKADISDYLESHPFDGLERVISISDVRKLFKPFKERKQLLSQYTHFVCDARVMNQLYNLLGKVFGNRNNYPVPVDFDGVSKIHAAVKKAVDSSYMHLAGKNISVRIGHTGMTARQITQNLLEGLPFAVEKLKDQWKSVNSIHLKSADSASIPLYSKVSNAQMEFLRKQKEQSEAASAASSGKKSKGKASSSDSLEKGVKTVKDAPAGAAPKNSKSAKRKVTTK